MEIIIPDWPAPDKVKAFSTCREGGVSNASYYSLNLAGDVGDDGQMVEQNRRTLGNEGHLPSQPVWLNQVHGVDVVKLDGDKNSPAPEADASITQNSDVVCAVMTADCLPILLCKKNASSVAAIHVGWRGLAAGIIENTVSRLAEPEQTLAWLGPAIGPGCFAVGAEVKKAFVDKNAVMAQAFRQIDASHYYADLYALARMALLQCGVKRMYGGEHCTYNQKNQFYSYRREPVTGRMASLIWLQS
ncbi:MAG: laccase [Cycloclasticus sp. symbiont of Poecilosclerida sp. N]|nr:MAG: laccase [Cycloclasticus sp. symbiont of Poecilosclerida sp. N]